MIEAVHLTKRYPGRVAVDDVSFTVNRGEIVGFLGPNGAGKTTTMRMLTGYLAPSGGRVSVAGYDVVEEPMEVRRRIGYLPEQCPLYSEMRVDEYLKFRARLKGLRGGRVRSRLAEVKSLCGIPDAGRRIIGQLSKGYRQRVGLAESLIHDPELLILDEPTIGLDPNQIRQARELIQSLARSHTILLSTHILSEVEALCGRVLILNRGRIVAADTPASLQKKWRGGIRVIAELRGPPEPIRRALASLPGVREVQLQADGEWVRCELACDAERDVRAAVFEQAAQQQWTLRELRQEKENLEDLFMALTRGEGRGTRG